MIYSLFADVVVLLHFAFVLFVGLGGFLVLKWHQLSWLHLPAVCWAVWISIRGAICPLTPLEQWLRQQGELVSYSGSFITHYITPVLYPSGLTQEMQWWTGVCVLLFNLLIYLWMFMRWQKPEQLG